MTSELLRGIATDKPSNAKEVLSVRIDPDIAQRLHTVSNKIGKSKAKVLTAMIEHGLTELEGALHQIDEIEKNNAAVSKFTETCEEGLKNGGLTQN